MKTYTLQFTDDMLKILNLAVGEIPTKIGVPFIQEVNRQILAQAESTPPQNEPADEASEVRKAA